MSAAQKSAVRRAALRLIQAQVGYTPYSAVRQAILKLRQGIIRA
jgi:hypothetical protein